MVTPMIILDPGHPSREGDRGVVCEGFIESDWAMNAALLTKDALRWLPVAVELTRHSQRPIGLRARGQLSSHKYQADLVISLHANANKDPRVHGMMSFHRERDHLAGDIGQRILETYGMPGRYIKNDELVTRSVKSIEVSKGHKYWSRAFNVLEHHDAPAVLIEAGFATNSRDCDFLKSRPGQQILAASIVCGVTYWLNGRGVD